MCVFVWLNNVICDFKLFSLKNVSSHSTVDITESAWNSI